MGIYPNHFPGVSWVSILHSMLKTDKAQYFLPLVLLMEKRKRSNYYKVQFSLVTSGRVNWYNHLWRCQLPHSFSFRHCGNQVLSGHIAMQNEDPYLKMVFQSVRSAPWSMLLKLWTRRYKWLGYLLSLNLAFKEARPFLTFSSFFILHIRVWSWYRASFDQADEWNTSCMIEQLVH